MATQTNTGTNTAGLRPAPQRPTKKQVEPTQRKETEMENQYTAVIRAAENGKIVWQGTARDMEDALQRAGFVHYKYFFLGGMEDAVNREIALGISTHPIQVELLDAGGEVYDCAIWAPRNLDPFPWEGAEILQIGKD